MLIGCVCFLFEVKHSLSSGMNVNSVNIRRLEFNMCSSLEVSFYYLLQYIIVLMYSLCKMLPLMCVNHLHAQCLLEVYINSI